ncbi:hypothetical protein HRW23_12060 [Streptomyces lunaelactis]|uniref:hypothetical protein n=1 Tax=Streptomyces lunaelactis TaxID=1535768 RepID=UPI0015851634|nr:hypothetical protein [Streptomyces lunaelactis]NUK13198.1 hypothetical protein [Streptomyces lunaelactis]NUK15639.1 hypothetical protein [Streptomyces lunaelactis]NUK33241.1 hypothetical protein [Streptomyces lunaelactis]NUK39686.1 hypothetical protein [Streptomyces lunaelactis]
MAAGEVREDPAGLGEADVGALPNGKVAEGLGDVCLSDPGGYRWFELVLCLLLLVNMALRSLRGGVAGTRLCWRPRVPTITP